MEQVFDFLARFGEVTFGALMLLVVIALIVIVVIEVVDFLIVDPIHRAQQQPTPETIEEED